MSFAVSFYIVGFLTSLVNPFSGLIFLTVSLLIRFQDRYPGIITLKPFFLLAVGLLLGCIFHQKKLNKCPYDQDRYVIYFVIFCAIGLLIMSPGSMLDELFSLLSSVLMYFFVTRIVTRPAQIYVLFFFMAITIAFMGYESIQSVQVLAENSPYIDKRTDRWQGIGYYANSNEFGQLMITTVPLMVMLLLSRKSLLFLMLLGPLIYIMIFVLGQTLSRTCMISLAMMMAMMMVMKRGGNIIKMGVMGIIVLSLLALTFTYVPGPIRDRLYTVTDVESDESFSGRTRSWGYGIDMVRWYPLTGVGKGQWAEYHGLAPHNSFIQILAETGPIGFFLFMKLITIPLRKFSFRLMVKISELSKDERSSRDAVVGVLATVFGFFLYAFLGNQAWAPWMYFYLGMLAVSQSLFLPELDENVDEEKLVNTSR